jgi:uncharacterized membrane protein
LKTSRANLLCLALVAASFVASAAVYGRLPERMPSHWNLAGNVDGYASKPWAPFYMPLTMAGLYLLFVVIRRASPRSYRLEGFAGALEIVEAATLAFLLTISIVVLLAGLGEPVSINRVVAVGMGLLFVVIGNFMGKFTRNFFAGIRTPWTLASDEVWLRTHRLGGKLWIAGGLVLFVTGLRGGGLTPLFFVLPVVAGVPAVYSYVIYRRLEGSAK